MPPVVRRDGGNKDGFIIVNVKMKICHRSLRHRPLNEFGTLASLAFFQCLDSFGYLIQRAITKTYGASKNHERVNGATKASIVDRYSSSSQPLNKLLLFVDEWVKLGGNH